MFTIDNGPAAVILFTTTLFLAVLMIRINPLTDTAKAVRRSLFFAIINISAVAGMYAFWEWAPLDWAYEFRTWAKLVDGLAAFGIAWSMFNIHKSLKVDRL